MKINVDQVLKTLDGRPIEEPRESADAPKGKDLTLKWVCNAALLAPSPKGAIDAAEHIKRLKLAWRIDKGGDVDLSTDDIKKAKDLIAELQWAGPLIVAQAHLMLERKTLDKYGNEVDIPMEIKDE